MRLSMGPSPKCDRQELYLTFPRVLSEEGTSKYHKLVLLCKFKSRIDRERSPDDREKTQQCR